MADQAHRSLRPDVRNPMLALPSMGRMGAFPAPIRYALADVLDELAADARQRAEQCWRKHKAPMAVYWKAVAVYAGHIARALRRAGQIPLL